MHRQVVENADDNTMKTLDNTMTTLDNIVITLDNIGLPNVFELNQCRRQVVEGAYDALAKT
jgi:hypothetical protein